MNLKEIRNAVGRKCSLLDSQGVFVDGLVLESDLTAMANERWKYLHLVYANKFPESSTIEYTGDLLEDVNTYNIGDGETEEMDISYVGVKFNEADKKYTRVFPSTYKRLFKHSIDTSKFHKTSPFYAIVPGTLDAGDPKEFKRALYLVPIPENDVEDGLLVRYVQVPDEMELDTDTPYTLPSLMHQLIVDYMVADVWQIKRDWANSNEAMGRATFNEDRFFKAHQPSSSDQPVRIDAGKRFVPNTRRRVW